MAILDRAEFDQAWQHLRCAVLCYASRLTNANDAEDLTQETYLLSVAMLHHYDIDTGQAGLKRWLCAILLNIHRTLQHQIERRREEQLSHEAARQIPDEDPETEDEEAEALERLLEDYQIHCLTRRRREVWQLYRKGLTQVEIAAALGIKQPTVSYHIGIIIQELQRAAGNLITRRDGYATPEALFRAASRAYIYRAPQRTGSGISARKLKRLR